jgi:hypothetical protein
MKAVLMGSNMNEESIFRKTLVLTGKLVGIFSIWVALLSFVVTVAASRVVVALSGSTADRGALAPTDAAKKDEAGPRKSPPVTAPNKPNG